jgi:hypothetical protein
MPSVVTITIKLGCDYRKMASSVEGVELMSKSEALVELRALIHNIQTGVTNEQEAIQAFRWIARYLK